MLAFSCLSLSLPPGLLPSVAADLLPLFFFYPMFLLPGGFSSLLGPWKSPFLCHSLSSLVYFPQERNYAPQRISVGRPGFMGMQTVHSHSTLCSDRSRTWFPFLLWEDSQQCYMLHLHQSAHYFVMFLPAWLYVLSDTFLAPQEQEINLFHFCVPGT